MIFCISDYVGCFRDKAQRALTGGMISAKDMTPDKCIAHCKSKVLHKTLDTRCQTQIIIELKDRYLPMAVRVKQMRNFSHLFMYLSEVCGGKICDRDATVLCVCMCMFVCVCMCVHVRVCVWMRVCIESFVRK